MQYPSGEFCVCRCCSPKYTLFSGFFSPEPRPGSPAVSAANAPTVNNAEHSTESVNRLVLVLMVLVLTALKFNSLSSFRRMPESRATNWMPAYAGMTDYFFAVFIDSGVYQIGDDQARS